MWRKALEDLHASGLTDQAIADLITEKGYKTFQSLIHRYRAGKIKTSSYEFAVVVLDVHKTVCKPKAKNRRLKDNRRSRRASDKDRRRGAA